ncbi:ABC transporter ATP-binding protein [Marinobacterium zhoushanense]|uniref:Branched-chain amino acid transport ATP-binding protein LivG n=2 Tax=Marinobacterium TaxID=48075 RepID=A0A081G1U5_9GAMM|nr:MULTISPECIES: ABC transporter ATP-binding protein [Marinobacterium]KEA64750.1 Branched-chain amino acid transport ATP-binding protein LivG [Marinobacterium lacunae]MBR9883252.1 ABC transporter ATP-binding protein [Oceanospirillales bacterium]GGC05391.1 ABC transporter ATP-binding protein [Marinobacterium zhoushanense]
MSALLETRNLERSFGAVTAAVDINVSINAGEVVGVIGSNGAGKTTFINMVTGYLKPSAGEILVDGRSIVGLQPRAVVRAGVGRSFQVAQLFPELSVLDNVLVALGLSVDRKLTLLRPLHSQKRRRKALEILAEYEIAGHADEVVATLPQGVRKLLDIAMAMLSSPRLMLLDEPTSGVAIEDKFALMETVMNRVRKSNAATLFVEHDMDVVQRYADRVLAFYDGRILADGTTAKVLSDPKVQELVVGHHLDIEVDSADAYESTVVPMEVRNA